MNKYVGILTTTACLLLAASTPAAAGLGGSCSPLEISCQCDLGDQFCNEVKRLDPAKRRELGLVKTAAQNSNLYVQASQDSRAAMVMYYDYQLAGWFKLDLVVYGQDDFVFTKSLWTGSYWRVYAERSGHPTIEVYRWVREDYAGAFAAWGRADSVELRSTLDGHSTAAMGSAQGVRAFRDLMAAQSVGRDPHGICTNSCVKGGLQLFGVLGMAARLGCGVATGGFGSMACGGLGGFIIGNLLVDSIVYCIDKCNDCYRRAVDTCRTSGNVPGDCVFDTPWTCRGGEPVPKPNSLF